MDYTTIAVFKALAYRINVTDLRWGSVSREKILEKCVWGKKNKKQISTFS